MITCPSSEILRQGSAAPRPIAPARRPLERATTCDRGASATLRAFSFAAMALCLVAPAVPMQVSLTFFGFLVLQHAIDRLVRRRLFTDCVKVWTIGPSRFPTGTTRRLTVERCG